MQQPDAPAFSILIPAFKTRFLKECIESVLSQTVADFELLILNDCSPEPVDDIVGSYDDCRIKYFKNEKNSGAIDIVKNWNKLLDLSTGTFVVCIGDDDRLLPNALEQYAKLIERYPSLNVYHGWSEIIDEHSDVYSMQQALPEYESVYSMMWHRWSGRDLFIGDFLYRSSYLKQAGGFIDLPMAWGSDDLTAFNAAYQLGIANTQVPVFQYRRNSLTISSGGDPLTKIKATALYESAAAEILSRPLPENPSRTEVTFHKMCRALHGEAFRKRRIQEVRNDMMRKGIFTGIFRWYRRKSDYRISNGMIAGAIFQSIKLKLRMR